MAESAESNDITFEARYLNAHPELRERVVTSPEFIAWKQQLRAITIDGEHLYIRGGDMMRDDDQIMFEWAWEKGLITQDDLDKSS